MNKHSEEVSTYEKEYGSRIIYIGSTPRVSHFQTYTVSLNYTLKSFLNVETACVYYLPTDFPWAGPSKQMVTNRCRHGETEILFHFGMKCFHSMLQCLFIFVQGILI